VAGFHPSPRAQERANRLIEREKDGCPSPEERSEPDHFLEPEPILRMAKAKARQVLARGR
jgi:hypothetical protein